MRDDCDEAFFRAAEVDFVRACEETDGGRDVEWD